jgi:hypothetical protein
LKSIKYFGRGFYPVRIGVRHTARDRSVQFCQPGLALAVFKWRFS